MPLGLHNLQSAQKKKRKRVGRGNASGHGTYSTRGMKGQRSRSGGRRKAQARSAVLIKSLPKLRGFKSPKPKPRVVNIGELNNKFKDGALISPATLLKTGLIGSIKGGVKILGQGKLELKNLQVVGCRVSQSAKGKIEKMGGAVRGKA